MKFAVERIDSQQMRVFQVADMRCSLMEMTSLAVELQVPSVVGQLVVLTLEVPRMRGQGLGAALGDRLKVHMH